MSRSKLVFAMMLSCMICSQFTKAQESGYIFRVLESHELNSISERVFWLPDTVIFNPLFASLAIAIPENHIGSEIFLLDLNGYDIDWEKGAIQSEEDGAKKVTYSIFAVNCDYKKLLMRIEEYENLYLNSSLYSRAPKVGNNKLFTEVIFIENITRLRVLTKNERRVFYLK